MESIADYVVKELKEIVKDKDHNTDYARVDALKFLFENRVKLTSNK